jgi:hypothetical protein
MLVNYNGPNLDKLMMSSPLEIDYELLIIKQASKILKHFANIQ